MRSLMRREVPRLTKGVARERVFSTCTAVLCALAFSACVSTSANTGVTSPSVRSSVVPVGARAETAAGNTVQVYSFLSNIGGAGPRTRYAAADVQACAGPNASSRAGVARALFAVETADKTGWPSIAPVKKPALLDTYLARGRCERGWISFRIPVDGRPVYVVLLATAVVRWKIP
jgi:hypothetical protein